MDCPECYGRGSIYRGVVVKTGMGGSYEEKQYDECKRCNGHGELPGDDRQELLYRIIALEKRVAELEIKADE